jgi:hypothetical protein
MASHRPSFSTVHQHEHVIPSRSTFADVIVEADHDSAIAHALAVCGQFESFSYKGRVVSVRQVGQELGVPMSLGRKRSQGRQSLRITAQLVESFGHVSVWRIVSRAACKTSLICRTKWRPGSRARLRRGGGGRNRAREGQGRLQVWMPTITFCVAWRAA